jgi:hypothetical protein
MKMLARCGVASSQAVEGVKSSVGSLHPLSQSPDKQLFAEALHGRGIVCYLSAGQVGTRPLLDMTYAVGGYLWWGTPSEVCWAGLDPVHGCVLAFWHPQQKMKIRKVYQTALPRVFRIVGIFPDDVILLEEGFLQKDFNLIPDKFVEVNLSKVRSQIIDGEYLFRRPLPHYQRAFESKSPKVRMSPVRFAGEYLDPRGRLFIRVAIGEGEAKQGSVWQNQPRYVQRVSETLHDVSSILWHPYKKDVVIASTNMIYGERAGIYMWNPTSFKWQVVRIFPDAISCRIEAISTTGALRVWVAGKDRTWQFNIKL